MKYWNLGFEKQWHLQQCQQIKYQFYKQNRHLTKCILDLYTENDKTDEGKIWINKIVDMVKILILCNLYNIIPAIKSQ